VVLRVVGWGIVLVRWFLEWEFVLGRWFLEKAV
jgi:hypothetical protein